MANLAEPLAARDEAVEAGLLEPGRMHDGTGSSVTFSHPLVRAAVLGDLPPGRRMELHLPRGAGSRLSEPLRGSSRPTERWPRVDCARPVAVQVPAMPCTPRSRPSLTCWPGASTTNTEGRLVGKDSVHTWKYRWSP